MSPIQDEFEKHYGRVGEIYDSDAYLLHLGFYASGWFDANEFNAGIESEDPEDGGVGMDAMFEKPTWAIVELMGRQVIAGEVTEVTVAGAAMLRVDVPAIFEDGVQVLAEYTKLFGAAALYAVTPVDEESARHAVAHLRVRPISAYSIPTRVLSQPRLPQGAGPDELWVDELVEDDDERPF